MGTSNIKFNKNEPSKDHPHACGDKQYTHIQVGYRPGSSPRVWGQVVVAMPAVLVCGIIPTRVGTRTSTNFAPSGLTDHPHACGDKGDFVILRRKPLGSSPRVWGQASYHKHFSDKNKIIPTRVGTSYKVIDLIRYCRDHPHACGDKVSDALPSVIAVGSSPRVWGQAFLNINGVSSFRIIPTRVGTRSAMQ